MGFSDLEREAKFRYEGQRNGWYVGPIPASKLKTMSSREMEFHSFFNKKNLDLAIAGGDAETKQREFESELTQSGFAEIEQNGQKHYLPVFRHPKQPSWNLVKLSDGKWFRADLAFQSVRFVDAVPAQPPPQSFRDAQAVQERQAQANLAEQRDAVRGPQLTESQRMVVDMINAAANYNFRRK